MFSSWKWQESQLLHTTSAHKLLHESVLHAHKYASGHQGTVHNFLCHSLVTDLRQGLSLTGSPSFQPSGLTSELWGATCPTMLGSQVYKAMSGYTMASITSNACPNPAWHAIFLTDRTSLQSSIMNFKTLI